MMKSVSQIRDRIGLVVPTYFQPSVPEDQIRTILEEVFRDQHLFCHPSRTVVVVDRDTSAEKLFKTASSGSPLYGWRLHSLDQNRAKAGAVEEGLSVLLDSTDAEFFATRDCDGDHLIEDLPRLVNMAVSVSEKTGNTRVGVMGARLSLEKPMGWLREEWEILTNRVLLDLIRFKLAQTGRLIDERFWSGTDADIQSGYRVYSREAARLTVDALENLPEDRTLWTFSCEFVPFAELLLAGGVFGQVQRLTLVEQPVSSYSGVDFAHVYGRLLRFLADRMRVDSGIILSIFDNHAFDASILFADWKEDVLRCRRLLDDRAKSPVFSDFL